MAQWPMRFEQRYSYWMIWISFIFAMALAVTPMPESLMYARPAWVPLLLVYWIMTTSKVGLLTAWILGVMLDALTGALLGHHALAMLFIGLMTVLFAATHEAC